MAAHATPTLQRANLTSTRSATPTDYVNDISSLSPNHNQPDREIDRRVQTKTFRAYVCSSHQALRGAAVGPGRVASREANIALSFPLFIRALSLTPTGILRFSIFSTHGSRYRYLDADRRISWISLIADSCSIYRVWLYLFIDQHS